ncbi:MAG: hypothetical protein Q9222_002204 [Ikaeria aurantiellina]
MSSAQAIDTGDKEDAYVPPPGFMEDLNRFDKQLEEALNCPTDDKEQEQEEAGNREDDSHQERRGEGPKASGGVSQQHNEPTTTSGFLPHETQGPQAIQTSVSSMGGTQQTSEEGQQEPEQVAVQPLIGQNSRRYKKPGSLLNGGMEKPLLDTEQSGPLI